MKSQFGLHIIKLTDKKSGDHASTLAEVRGQLEDQIKLREGAGRGAARSARRSPKEIDDPADLDTVAKARGLTVGDSGLFRREEPLAGLGFAPAVASEAFSWNRAR